jgi:hypothetical protein
MNNHIVLVWVMIPYSLIDLYPERGGSMFLRNAGTHTSHSSTVPQSGRPEYETCSFISNHDGKYMDRGYTDTTNPVMKVTLMQSLENSSAELPCSITYVHSDPLSQITEKRYSNYSKRRQNDQCLE